MAQQKQKKSRPSTRNKPATATRRRYEKIVETDGTYFLKLIVVVLLGTLWLKFQTPVVWLTTPLTGIPVGLLLGLVFVTRFEKLQSDRKIWYAILVVVTIISYFVPAGIVL